MCLTAGQRHYAHLSPFSFPVLLAADLLLQGCQLTQYTEGYTLALLEFARKVGTPSVRGLGTWIATKCAPRTSKSMQQGRTIQQPRRPNPSPKRLPSSRRAEPASVETTVVFRTSRFCSSLLLPYFREANRSPFRPQQGPNEGLLASKQTATKYIRSTHAYKQRLPGSC